MNMVILKGSPPLAWGILQKFKKKNFSMRITPTCVGNTHLQQEQSTCSEDHPHLRGEYLFLLQVLSAGRGSPPLAWGILVKNWQDEAQERITPTCVGNTCRKNLQTFPAEDHPHLRGEYLEKYGYLTRKPGSPPLAWGIHNEKMYAWLAFGITPTCVGNTFFLTKKRGYKRDHPHLRGEYCLPGHR